jgi:hypothetical protein
MKNRFLALLLALAMSPTPIVLAQASPTPPVAAPADKPGPRLLTPEEKRDNVSPHDHARPEGTVTPQIHIPLGKKSTPPQKAEPRKDPLSRRPPPPAIDDDAARCSALVDAAERASCFDRHSRAHQ